MINQPLSLLSNRDVIYSRHSSEILREIAYKSTKLLLVERVNCHFSDN